MKTIRRFRALLPVLAFAFCAHSAFALNCGGVVNANVTLTADLQCAGTGLSVVADNVTINLNGHTISCTGNGFAGSCQTQAGPAGILVIHHSGVQIVGPGTIKGFGSGILVDTGKGVHIKGVKITGPPQTDVVGSPRGTSFGIVVENGACTVGILPVPTVTVDSNEVMNQLVGIQVQNTSCVTVTGNTVHDNDGPLSAYGINLVNTTYSTVVRNLVYANGSNNLGLPPDAGIAMTGLATQHNLVEYNTVLSNCGNGIAAIAGASGNSVYQNVARFNPTANPGQCHVLSTQFPGYDLATTNSQVNSWNANNMCRTQTPVNIPAGVCNPGE